MFVKQVLAGAALVATVYAAEDHLYSRRHLEKRFIDENGNWNMSFYHINDVHAHLDEFTSSGTDCEEDDEECFGGYARVKGYLDQSRPDHPDSLLLNAGDEFQGTLFYSFYGGEKIAVTINQLGFDAMTLGNHEFDGGDEELAEFLQNITFPIVSCNIQTDHPVLNATIEPYHIYEEYDLAVIGATTIRTPNIASPGENTIFLDVVESVQAAIDEIRSTTNITRIAALTHIGIEEDIRLAEETTGLYLIMGGHSHTLLGDMEDAEGPYPTMRQNLEDEDVFIVQAFRWGEYLGYIDVTYDAEGRVLAYHGAPMHMTDDIPQDESLQEQVVSWRAPFEAYAAEVIGEAATDLEQSNCQQSECTLGNFMTDAMLTYRLNVSDTADFALINAGGIRASIEAGPITRGQIITAFPFGNAIVEIPISGSDLLLLIEGILSGVSEFNNEEVTSFFQISRNIIVTYNPDSPEGSKLVSVTVSGEPVDPDEEYNMVTLDFIAGGGDNFFAESQTAAPLDLQDEVLSDYVISQSPVEVMIEGRIVETDDVAAPIGGGNGTVPVAPGNGTVVPGNGTVVVPGNGTVVPGNGTVVPGGPNATLPGNGTNGGGAPSASVEPSEGAAASARSTGVAAVLVLVALSFGLVL